VSPRVVLVGPPGALVEEVADALGGLLGAPVRSTDRDVEEAAGADVAEIFVTQGESAFRDLEHVATAEALTGHHGVLVLGGGAPMDPRTEADLGGHTVVFLDASLSAAARRLGFTGSTHVVNPRAQWKRMMDARRPVYERVAAFTVSTDDRDPAEVAEELRRLLPA